METIFHYLSGLLASNQFLQGGFVLAAFSWVFYQLKSWPVLVWNKLKYFATYQVYFDDSNDFYTTFSEWFAENHPQKFRNVEIRFYFNSDDQGSQNRPMAVTEQAADTASEGWTMKRFQFNDNNLLVHKGRVLWVKKERMKLEMAGRDLAFINSYSLSGFFARKAIDSLCEDLLQRKRIAAKKISLRVGINTDGGYFEWKDVEIVKSLSHIFFDQKVKLIHDLESFLEKKEFYKQRGINFKRSYLFFGPAGTGKTSLASAIAKHLDYSLYVINLASLKDDLTLQRIGANIGKRSVVLLEDVDCILTDREVKSENLNFSTILNFLDGLYAPSDCVFVLTTNHPEALDPALIRKGRVDLALKVDFPAVREVSDFMEDFYGESVALPVLSGRVRVGMSEIQDICLQNDIESAKRAIAPLFLETNGHKKEVAVKV